MSLRVNKGWGRQLAVFAVAALVASVFGIGRGAAHTGAWIDSAFAAAAPTIDGTMGAGEWSDAAAVDLAAIPGNTLPAFLLVKNDATYLYAAYDAVGDTTVDPGDSASVAFDTDHDLFPTPGREDQFFWGGFAANGEEHWVSDGFSWFVEDSPFNTGLPNHAGLDSAYGFGTSDNSGTAHRIYELRIPLALLGTLPGDAIGFLGASQPFPGVVDFSAFAYSTWPDLLFGPPPLDRYGDLRLGKPSQANDLDINPPSQSQQGTAGSPVFYALQVWNRGTAADTFDLTVGSPWVYALLDVIGNPLPDTDGDTVPDTGAVPPSGNTVVVVRIDIPPATIGCSDAMVVGTSSNDVGISDDAILHTCVALATLSPPHADVGVDTDAPPNGKFDILEIDVNVFVNVDGLYAIDIALFDQTQSIFITFGGAFQFLPMGPQTVAVSLQGSDIYASGINGPYVAVIQLYDDTFTLLDTDTHLTAAYLSTDFDPPAGLFNPPHLDLGEDTDVPPNGLFDVLVIELSVTVNEPGSFQVDGVLLDPNFSFITTGFGSANLNAGNQVIRLEFLGRDIYNAGLNGPYTAFINLYKDFSFQDSDSHTTGFYAFTDFDPPPATFGAPHTDRGIDLDSPPDGFLEFLEVSAAVDVTEPGRYIVLSQLWDPTFSFTIAFTETVVDLAAGPRSVPLRFNGAEIWASGIDGPYVAELFLADGSGFLDFDVYTTAFYAVTDFAPPGASFSPPHADRLMDSDGDGLADFLAVDASVLVATPGAYEVRANLFSFSGAGTLAFASSDCGSPLPAGPGTCALLFDGHILADLGIGGQLGVQLDLYDGFGRLVDQGFHATALLSPSDFEPTDRRPPSGSTSPVPYFRNRSPVAVPYAASDASPSDGLATVTLHYRYSASNATWGAWQPYLTVGVTGNAASGTVPFSFPAGPGYYEFQVTAQDVAGNAEPLSTAESRVRFQPLATLSFFPALVMANAGQARRVTIEAYGTDGQRAILETPLTVNLATTSPAGEFRLPGTTTAITSATIPAGQFSVDVDYYDTRAGVWTIRASSDVTADGTAEVDVANAGPATVVIDPPVATLEVGATLQFSAQVFDAYGNPAPPAFVWSADPAIGTISAGGLLTAATVVGSGTVTVSVPGFPSVRATATVTLVPGPPATVVVDPPTGSVAVDGTLSFTATVQDQYGNAISGAALAWSVTGGIGSVDATGTFTAGRIAGTGTVVARVGSVQGSGGATVTPGPPAAVLVTPSSEELVVTASVTFSARVVDQYGNEISATITWSVGGGIGTITSAGVFNAGQRAGVGDVIATSTGLQGTATVVLVPGAASEVRILPPAATAQTGSGVELRAEVVDQYGNVIPDAPVTWIVSGPGALSATSGASTTLSLTGAGTVTVTASSGGASGTARFGAVEPGTGAAAVTGIGVGGVIAGLAIGFAVGWILRRRAKREEEEPSPPPEGKA